MHADKGALRHGELTEQIIGAAYKVHNVLGYGFAEKLYENALVHELRKGGLKSSNRRRSWCRRTARSWANTSPTQSSRGGWSWR
jgi:hypothetical protein